MAGPFGSTFAPTEDAAEEAKRRGGPFGGQRQQAALRVLRLDAPSSFGPQAPAADALLRPRIGAGGPTPDNAVLASIIKALLGPQADTSGIWRPGMHQGETGDFSRAVGPAPPSRSPGVSIEFGDEPSVTPPSGIPAVPVTTEPPGQVEKQVQGPFPAPEEPRRRVPSYKRDLIREG